MALQQLDNLIAAVEATKEASPVEKAAATTFDIAWAPLVPPGHTEYSWMGDESLPAVSPAPAKQAPAKKPEQKQEPKQQQKKQQQKQKQPKQKRVKAPPKPVVPNFYRLQIVVGKIVSCQPHEGADKLYEEKIDIGEAEPRQILSGVQKLIPLENMIGAECLVVANLKPAPLGPNKMMSYGMILCASPDKEKKACELVKPPEGASPGDRVYLVGGEEDSKLPFDESVKARKKNSPWAKCAPDFKTDAEGFVCFGEDRMCTSSGVLRATSMPGGIVS